MADTPYPLFDSLELMLDSVGEGPPVMVLHGGGGPATVAPIASRLAQRYRTVTPTHPGWNGVARPDGCDSIADLAMAYLRYLDGNGLSDVTIIGSSIGGWIATEMAVRDTAGLIGKMVLINSVGVAIQGEPITDFFALDARGVAEHSYHQPNKFYADPASMPPERLALMRGNMASLRVYAQDPYMHDAKLLGRLRYIQAPTLVLWGESDRIVAPGYGQKLAAAIPGAHFELIRQAGHLPQIEQPEATMAAVERFLAAE